MAAWTFRGPGLVRYSTLSTDYKVVLNTVLSIVLNIVLNNSFRYTSGSSGRNIRGDKNLSTMLVDRSVDYDNLSTRWGDACGAAGLLFVPKNLSTEKPVDSSRLA